MPLSFLFPAIVTALVWGLWPPVMKLSALNPWMKGIVFTALTLLVVSVAGARAGAAELRNGATPSAVWIAVAAGVLNGIGTVLYQKMLSDIPAPDTATFIAAMLVMMAVVSVVGSLVLQGGRLTPARIAVCVLALLTMAASAYSGIHDRG